jgi:itaconyl-CoA hydratase
MPDFQMGRWYEDFVVGEVIKHRPGRTILESDNTLFTLLTGNTHPIHFDHHYASKTQFGRPLVNSTLTLAVVAGMSVTDTSYRSIANLEWEFIKMPNPVFHGDTLYAETEILDKRESKSKPDRGIVHMETRAHNQRGELVMEYRRKSLAAKKGMGAIPDYDNIPLDGK